MVIINGNKALVIRCHKCGILKDSNNGIFVEWQFSTQIGDAKIIVWFDKLECKEFWIDAYKLKNYKESTFSEHYGFMKMPKGDDIINTSKGDDLNE